MKVHSIQLKNSNQNFWMQIWAEISVYFWQKKLIWPYNWPSSQQNFEFKLLSHQKSQVTYLFFKKIKVLSTNLYCKLIYHMFDCWYFSFNCIEQASKGAYPTVKKNTQII